MSKYRPALITTGSKLSISSIVCKNACADNIYLMFYGHVIESIDPWPFRDGILTMDLLRSMPDLSEVTSYWRESRY